MDLTAPFNGSPPEQLLPFYRFVDNMHNTSQIYHASRHRARHIDRMAYSHFHCVEVMLGPLARQPTDCARGWLIYLRFNEGSNFTRSAIALFIATSSSADGVECALRGFHVVHARVRVKEIITSVWRGAASTLSNRVS